MDASQIRKGDDMNNIFKNEISKSINTGEIVEYETLTMTDAEALARELAEWAFSEGIETDSNYENDDSLVVHGAGWAIKFTGWWVDDIGPDRW